MFGSKEITKERKKNAKKKKKDFLKKHRRRSNIFKIWIFKYSIFVWKREKSEISSKIRIKIIY